MFASFDVNVEQVPNTILNGLTESNWSIKRRADQTDQTESDIQIFLTKDTSEMVYPRGLEPSTYFANIFNPCKDVNADSCKNIFKSDWVSPDCNYDICDDWSCLIQLLYKSHENPKYIFVVRTNTDMTPIGNDWTLLNDGKEIIFYTKNQITKNNVVHLTELPTEKLTAKVKVQLPENILEFYNHTNKVEKTYFLPKTSYQTSTLSDINSITANELMNKINYSTYFPKSHFKSFALNNGLRTINTNIKINMWRSSWKYSKKTKNLNCRYEKLVWETTTQHTAIYPVIYFEWDRISNNNIVLNWDDSSDIEILSSTAWIKTQDGFVGTNQWTTSEGTTSNEFTWEWDNDLEIISKPKDYAPFWDSNADFMIFSSTPANRKDDFDFETFEFSTSANTWTWNDWFFNTTDDLSFITDSSYTQDLDNNLFSEVIDFNKYCSGTCHPRYWNITRNWNNFIINWELKLIKDKIYHFDWNVEFQNTVVSWSNGRIYTTWDITITWDIKYMNSTYNNITNITNLRLDAENITVAPEVTNIEAQLLARDTFSSWTTRDQLRILWDIIAEKTHFERQPTSTQNFVNNPSSELIIEDFRKILLPSPWDNIKNNSMKWWHVNPFTWDYIDFY